MFFRTSLMNGIESPELIRRMQRTNPMPRLCMTEIRAEFPATDG